MDLVLFLLAYWEFYAFVAPYLLFGFWTYRWIGRRVFTNSWTLFAAGILFWLVFLAGFVVVSFAAELFIMFRHAEHV
jgi:hypothetical protein